MFCDIYSLKKYNLEDNTMSLEKRYDNGLAKSFSKYKIKNINNNFEVEDSKRMVLNYQMENVKTNLNIPPPANTMRPPPQHRIGLGNNNNISTLSYPHWGSWKGNFSGGRPVSPLSYDSDESSKSYGSKGNLTEEHGK